MSGPNPSELGKSQIQENPITRSQVKKNTELAKILAQNQNGLLKGVIQNEELMNRKILNFAEL